MKAMYDPNAPMDFTPVAVTGVSQIRRETIIGRCKFRFPSEMTLQGDAAKAVSPAANGERVNLRFSEGDGEPFYLSATVELLGDGRVRLFDMRAHPHANAGTGGFHPRP